MCEAVITWAPSYKFKKGKYDEKRAPSYCDRVLWDDGSAHGKLAPALTPTLLLSLTPTLTLAGACARLRVGGQGLPYHHGA